MLKKIILVTILALLAVGIAWKFKDNKSYTAQITEPKNQAERKQQQTNEKPKTESVPEAMEINKNVKMYTLEEVAQHGPENPDSEDCWMVIHDKVYSVDEFILKHPGGEQMSQGCGIDATTLFETRPMGSGTPHSAEARKILEKYYIGDLKK